MIYFFSKIYKCNVQYFVKKRAWNTDANSCAHDRGLCLWRRVIPVCRYIWRSMPDTKEYECYEKKKWFLGGKDKSVFKYIGRI